MSTRKAFTGPGDLRKPFYEYAKPRMTQDQDGRTAAFVFADWAVDFMSEAAPSRAFAAYIAARL